jgi:predicted DNA-binding protein with PD1-like motif
MEYKKIDNTIAVRIYKGEDVIEQIKNLAAAENIKAGTIFGLGAGNSIEIGIFDLKEKTYKTKIYEGMFEITSLIGNLSIKDNEPYLHMHINFSDEENKVYGGHLVKCVIALTAEIFINILDGNLQRKFDSTLGGFMLNLK